MQLRFMHLFIFLLIYLHSCIHILPTVVHTTCLEININALQRFHTVKIYFLFSNQPSLGLSTRGFLVEILQRNQRTRFWSGATALGGCPASRLACLGGAQTICGFSEICVQLLQSVAWLA